MKVIVCGPPHSGKSVFLYGLCKLLPREQYFLLRAAPDGEGSWTYRNDLNADLRRKGQFDRPFMDYVLNGLRNTSAPLTLVDVGGVRSPENERIFRECDAFIVLSSSDEELEAWRQFGEGLGLRCLALLKSDLQGEHSLESAEVPRGTVAGLERGQLVISPAHEALANALRLLAQKSKEDKSMNSITTANLALILGKAEVERTLPNGKLVSQLVWEGTDLPLLQERVFGPLAAAGNEPVCLDGPAPAWLATAFVHGVHPRCAQVNDPRLGAVDIFAPKPSGSGEGRNLQFRMIETESFTFVEFEIEGGVFDVADLPTVHGPMVNPQKGVVISGRGPNWLMATLAMGYHTTRWVACWQPGSGATCAMTHHPSMALGTVISEVEVRKAREGIAT